MKDELEGAIMTGFIALRPKFYSFRKLDAAEDKNCKRNQEVCGEEKLYLLTIIRIASFIQPTSIDHN